MIKIIKQAYEAGARQASHGKFITPDIIHYHYTKFFIDLFNEIKTKAEERILDEGKEKNKKERYFGSIEIFRQLHHDEIIHDVINEILLDNGISPFSIATDVELSVQTSYIKGYLEHQQISENKYLEFELNTRGGSQLISDWLYSLLAKIKPRSKDITHNDLLNGYFSINHSYSPHAIFTLQNIDLAEDKWITKRSSYGKIYHVELHDDEYFGNKEIIGGSYEFVKHFADSKTHEVHHLIPAKLLKLAKILDYMEGPCIRIEIEDHKSTRSYKKSNMLEDKYFVKQLKYLENNNIRAAVEMEISDLRNKFGSKYDDAFKEVMEYVSKLEEKLKKSTGVTHA